MRNNLIKIRSSTRSFFELKKKKGADRGSNFNQIDLGKFVTILQYIYSTYCIINMILSNARISQRPHSSCRTSYNQITWGYSSYQLEMQIWFVLKKNNIYTIMKIFKKIIYCIGDLIFFWKEKYCIIILILHNIVFVTCT